jgi:protein SCO1/2
MTSLCASAAQEPSVFTEVAFDQHIDEQLPLSLEFRNHAGETVSLEKYFGTKPVILSLVYYECPMLCTLELNGLVKSLKTLDLSAGKDFTLLTVSFDPGETPVLAAEKRRSYLAQYDRPGADADWQFLTGDRENIKALCESVGFRYVYDPQRDEYAHASGIVVLTPDGKISRYFFGIEYPARDLQLGLVEASSGKVGSVTDQLLLLCYGYDPTTGRYGFLVMSAVRLGGVATVIGLGGFIGATAYRERCGRRS